LIESSNARPLAGLRIVDIATYIAAPYCATIMAEFGAEVIKVEQPGVGDPCRRLGTVSECGDTLVWLSEARNKKSVTLNLKSPEGAAILKRLVAKADALTENFQPGTLEEWGLGWDVLREINPRLVMLRVSGYGQTGPYSHKPGFGRIGNAFGGISFLAGDPDGPPVTPGSATLADYMAGLYGALGVLMALQERERSGRGQLVEAALYDSGLALLHPHAANWFMDGRAPKRTGNAHPNIYPYDALRTGTDPVFVAVGNDRQFAAFCRVIGMPDLAAHAEYATAGARSANRDALKAALEAQMAALDGRALVEDLMAAGVPAAPVLDVEAALRHPHTAHRGMVVEMEGGWRGLGSPIKLDRTPASYRHVPLTPGERFAPRD